MTYKKVEAQNAKRLRKFLRKLAGWHFLELRNWETAEPQLRYGIPLRVLYIVSFGPKVHQKSIKIQNNGRVKKKINGKFHCFISNALQAWYFVRQTNRTIVEEHGTHNLYRQTLHTF